MPHPFHLHPVTSSADWAHARAIRQRVFVEEQQCPPEAEWDAFDATSRHVLGRYKGTPMATARWRSVGYDGRIVAKLERFAVLPEYRGHGYGRQLVAWVVDDARRAGFSTFLLHAQAHLEDFYRSLGFNPLPERFIEAGIPHVAMIRREA